MYAGTGQGPTIHLVRRLPGRLPTGALGLALAFLGGLLLAGPWSGRAAAQEPEPSVSRVDVVEVSGLIDPVVVDFVGDRLRRAARRDSAVVVIVLDSPGAVVSASDLEALAASVTESPVPVAVWVGPSGAEARHGAERLVAAAALSGMATRATIDHPRTGERLSTGEAEEAGVVDVVAPVAGDFIVELDGRNLGGSTLDVAEVVGEGRDRRQQPRDVTFSKLPFFHQLMHTVASPPVAYLLLSFGLALLVLEFFTAGVGVAGLTGAGGLLLAAYGLDVLPVQPLGLALLVVGVGGFAIDIQTGVPRLWTAIGVVAYTAGSLLLFERPEASLSWVPLVAGIAGMALMMFGGIPAVVRSRFSTPTIGRESIIGEEGEAVADVSPDGVVRVRDALWRAHTNRVTPIAAGAPVRVVAIDGPRLEVEPSDEDVPG